MAAWETFITLKGKSTRPIMAIHSYGQITINAAAVRQFKLYEYQFVVLKINQDDKKIGLMFTQNEKEAGAKKIRIKPQGGITLPVKSFIENYKLSDLKPNKFNCEWVAASNMVVAVYAN